MTARYDASKKQNEKNFSNNKTTTGTLSSVSIIVPLYNEEQSLPILLKNITSVMDRRSWKWEIIFVDDGSTDGSFRTLQNLRREHPYINVIRFRKNCGKSAALSVGFAEARGDVLITMDADLQDDPGEIPKLIDRIREGYDVVSGWKRKRKDPISKTIPSKFFNLVTSIITGIHIHDFNCGLKAYRKKVVKEIDVYGELHRYLPVLAHWKGFEIGEVKVQHHARAFGKTKFGASRFFSGFYDLLTVILLTRYTVKPLHLFGSFGLFFFLAGLVIGGCLTALRLIHGPEVVSFTQHFPLLLLGILLVLVGIQFFSTGLIAEMITNLRTDRGRYVIDRKLHGKFTRRKKTKSILHEIKEEVKKESQERAARQKRAPSSRRKTETEGRPAGKRDERSGRREDKTTRPGKEMRGEDKRETGRETPRETVGAFRESRTTGAPAKPEPLTTDVPADIPAEGESRSIGAPTGAAAYKDLSKPTEKPGDETPVADRKASGEGARKSTLSPAESHEDRGTGPDPKGVEEPAPERKTLPPSAEENAKETEEEKPITWGRRRRKVSRRR